MGLQVQITIVVVQSTCLLLALFGGVNTQTRLANPVIASTPLVPELGQNLTLHCNAPAGVNVSRFSWLKNFAVLVGNEGPSISLNPLTKSDDGVYVCLYFNENNSQSPESNQYDLLVSPPDPPVLEANPPGPLFQTSGYVYLTCKTSGNNVQTYFFRNGVLITTQTWSTYYIYPNSRSLSGNYTCSARNSKGQSEPSNIVKIIFVDAPVITSINTDPKIGDDLTLNCNTYIQESNLGYIWTKNNDVLSSANLQTLIKTNLSSSDAGVYKCAFNIYLDKFTSSNSDGFFVLFAAPESPAIEASPGNVSHGSYLSIRCTANQTTLFGSEWSFLYHNGIKIAKQNSSYGYSYYTQNALYKSAGNYTCTFSNKKGESEQSSPVFVNVTSWIPGDTSLPRESQIRVYNENPQIYCQQTSYFRNIQYCTLYVGDIRYVDDQDCSFLLPHGVTGTYRCSASSTDGTGPMSNDVNVTFIERPVIVPISNGPPVINQIYSLLCLTTIDGGIITWYKDYDSYYPLSSNSTLDVLVLNSQAVYRYRCKVQFANSFMFSDTFQFYAAVPDTPSFSRKEKQPTLISFNRNITNFNCYSSNAETVSLYANGVKVSTKLISNSTFYVANGVSVGVTYTCVASNKVGDSNFSVPIYLPAQNEIVITASSVLTSLGQPLTLTCTLKSHNPNATYNWHFYNTLSQQAVIEGRQVLSFDALTKSHEGLYACVAYINAIEIISDNYYVVAFERPNAPGINGPNGGVINNERPSRAVRETVSSGSTPNTNLTTFECFVNTLLIDIKSPFRLYKDGKEVTNVPFSDEIWFGNMFNIRRFYTVDFGTPDSEGNYSCTAINSFGESEPTITVFISRALVLPKPWISANSSNPMIGQTLTLTCHVPGIVGDEQISWNKDFNPIIRNGKILNLASLLEDDDGVYTCSYSNRSNRGYTDMWFDQVSDPYLLALRPPLQPMLTLDPAYVGQSNRYYYYEDGPVFIAFSVDATVHLQCFSQMRSVAQYQLSNYKMAIPYNYALFSAGQQVGANKTGGQFSVTGLLPGEHNFTCITNNGFSDSVRSYPLLVKVTVKTNITSSSTSPDLGTNITLTCNTLDASNGFDITWQKNGITLLETSKTLILSNINKYDEGRYTCRQKSGVWSLDASDAYLLEFGSRAVKPEIFTYRDTTVIVGWTVKVYCLSLSTTSFKAVLYKNGQPVSSSTQNSVDDGGQILFLFSLLSVTVSDTGNYACTVENGKGVSEPSDSLAINVVGEVGCNAGYFKSYVASCQQCPYGSYQPDSGKTECISCPGNLFTLIRAASNISQCVAISDGKLLYLRITINMSNEDSTEPDVKTAVRSTISKALSQVKDYVGALASTVLNESSSSNEVVVIVSVVSTFDVTNDFSNNLGAEIYTKFYRNPYLVLINGVSHSVKAVNMFLTQADSLGFTNHIDIDECSLTPTVCGQLERCNNRVGPLGSFVCSCISGYQRVTSESQCTDVDECLQTNLCTGTSEQCVNTPGSYICDCISGYTRRSPQDPCTNFNRTQQSLYPYGADKGDTKLSQDRYAISNAVVFENGLPFGSEKHYNLYVSNNGMISVGTPQQYWYWGELSYRFGYGHKIICPFMTDIKVDNGSEILYHLYKKSTDSGPTQANVNTVLQRASADVFDNFGIAGFNPKYVFVATWVRVESQVDYYYYGYYYGRFRRQAEAPNVVTFQSVIITDGETSYLIFFYKSKEFNWPYIRGRSVSVGYVNDLEYVDFVEHGSFLISSLDEIIGNKGRQGTWLAQIGYITNSDQRCQDFYSSNAYLLADQTFLSRVAGLFECPCSVAQMGRQWSQVSAVGTKICFALNSLVTRFFGHTYNKLCCYHSIPNLGWWNQRNTMTFISSPPEAGFVTLYDPFSWSATVREHRIHDMIPHRWCCEDADSSHLCELFYQVRPNKACSNTSIIISGIALGDPHIQTLDGVMYTFNGWGEYIMAWVTGKNFTMQARTAKATKSDGSESQSATVFSAVAAKEGNYSHFQAELSTNKDRLIIYANGQDYTAAFYSDPTFSVIINKEDLMLTRTDLNGTTTLSANFPSGVEISVSVGLRSLNLGVTMVTTLNGQTKGLLGNLNNNITDEFQLPNGTILRPNLTDKEIFYQFGPHWAVTAQNSVFIYPVGESWADYNHPEFTPKFSSDINSTTLRDAQAICGVQNDACIFDYAATLDPAFAENTKKVGEEGNQTRLTQENTVPAINLITKVNGLGFIEVTEGQPATIQVNTTDPDGNFDKFELVGAPASVNISQSGIITFTPNASVPVTISVVAVDSLGGRSTTLTISLALCTLCSGHGQCNKSVIRPNSEQGGNFQKFACQCRAAYTGADCEKDFDACSDNPCSQGQNCSDTPASLQDSQGVGSHTCGPCHNGSQNVSNKCIDIDECVTNPCSQQCNNTIGSYQCSCYSGYRLSNFDGKTCIDINECAEQTHRCEQKCVNTPGSYNCSCEQGYTLQGDKYSCQLSVDNSVCSNSGCDQLCIIDADNRPTCSCKSFYTFDSQNPTACVDTDECSHANQPCDQVCTNKAGGYECSCYPGYKLAQDSTTCTPCESPSYGTNCTQTCMCGGHSLRCDPVKGCICQSGWTGPSCDTNINECETGAVCGLGEICHDLVGSYECKCVAGYTRVNGTCVDIDECADVLAHNCDLSQQQVCRNTQGNYTCDCQAGFSKTAGGFCQDFNECTSNSHNCQQLCVNNFGGFSCSCYFGSRLDDTDRTKCVLSKDVCKDESNLTCSHGCTVNLDTREAFCYCNSGYRLAADKQTCIDVNECSDANLNGCSLKDSCVNTPGGYTCSCLVGFRLDNDNRTCIGCSGQTWGISCSNNCTCTTGADQCSPVMGCVCKRGFTGKYCEFDVNECETSTPPCQSPEKCVNSVGSYSCQCPSGYRKVNQTCVDIDECSNPLLNTCDQGCVNRDGGHTCSCFIGFTYNVAEERCNDVNECVTGTALCEQSCVNTLGSYRCSCGNGYQLANDGVSCRATAQCPTKKCAHSCAVIEGVETCSCPRGQNVSVINELQCQDVDLCASSSCQQGCQENEAGNDFTCSCGSGFKLAGDKVSCEACPLGRYGSNCLSTCSCVMDNTYSCNPNNGSCICLSGWGGPVCNQDVNECTSTPSPCTDPNSECVNTQGSYFCHCKDGYLKKNASTGLCEACDENFYGPSCAQRCQCNTQNSACNKVTGSCTCNSGWEGPTCDRDINECDRGTHNCGNSTLSPTCKNEAGSFQCVCPKGYKKISGANNCTDIDECQDPGLNSCEQTCTNSLSSYTCSCRMGFAVQPDGSCKDINECERSPSPCSDLCQNTIGSYRCTCAPGYGMMSNGSCLDVDECSSSPCKVNQLCNNTAGSYVCVCPKGYTLSTTTGECTDIDECATTKPCQQYCNNTQGGYNCSCYDGFTLSVEGKCIVVYSRAFEIRFPFFSPADSFLNPSNDEYKAVVKELQNVLRSQLGQLLQGFLNLIVKNLKKGSLIAEVEASMNAEANPNAGGSLIKAMTLINLTAVTVNGTRQEGAYIKAGSMELTSATSQCDIRSELDPCTADTFCALDSDGTSYCRPYNYRGTDNRDKYIGIGIGVGVAGLIIIGVIVAACVVHRNKAKKYRAH